MILYLAMGAVLAQSKTTQTEQPRPFISPFFIAEPRRLALTPKLDGRHEEEEWDELSSETGLKSYLQWAPGKLFVAASAANGKDVIISLDLKANGWLIGNDNVEVRVSLERRTLTARRLDVTNPNAPVWHAMRSIEIASLVHVGKAGRRDFVEVELRDPEFGLFNLQNDDKFGVRIDEVDADAKQADPFQPRVMGNVQLATYRAQGLPAGLTFAPRDKSNVFSPGENAHMRLIFNGSAKSNVDKIGIRSEGFSKDDTSVYVTPFPTFDRRNKATVEYVTAIRRKAEPGWRLLRGTLSTYDSLTSLIQMSYYVAPEVEIYLPPKALKQPAKQTKIKLPFYVISHSDEAVTGTITLVPPPGFTMANEKEQFFSISSPNGQIIRFYELNWDNARTGTYPVEFRLKRGTQETVVKEFLTVEANSKK